MAGNILSQISDVYKICNMYLALKEQIIVGHCEILEKPGHLLMKVCFYFATQAQFN